MNLVDVHCHLTTYSAGELKEVIQKIEAEMSLVVTSGITPTDNLKSLEIARNTEKILVTFGLNPVSLGRDEKLFEEYLKAVYANSKIVSGIGEVGLDYYWEKEESGRARQREFFPRFIDLARELGKPLIVHSRSAMKDTLAILERHTPDKFFIHSFRGSPSQARKVVDLGGLVSLSTAMVRFPKEYTKLINSVPLEYILTETDAPYLAPRKGEQNYPWNVRESIAFIAQTLDQDMEDVAKQVYKNAISMFGMM